MSGRPMNKIMEEIYSILKKEKEMSIRQLSIKTNSQWLTIEKSLDSLKKLEVVKEILDNKNNRKTRLLV
jgi:predicted transcriptional regulator